MATTTVRVITAKNNRRIFHWTVAVAFFTLFITGLIVFVPAFSGLAAGGWTRLVHRAAAVILVGAPLIYALVNTRSSRQWLKEAIPWNKGVSNDPSRWKRTHKTLVTIGLALFVLTGMIQWFFKGIVSNQVFQLSLTIHDITFFAAIVILLYHVYSEFDWWLWKRRYCRNCSLAYCVDACPSRALSRNADGTIEYYPARCNNCRQCMSYCRSNSYFTNAAKPKEVNPLSPLNKS